MKNNELILTKLEDCIYKVREKGVLLEDEELVTIAKDLVQVKQEMNYLLQSAQSLVNDIRSLRDDTEEQVPKL